MPDSKKVSEIYSMDLGDVCAHASEKNGWNDETAQKAEIMYRAFLAVALENDQSRLVPTREIDEFWHSHILHTQSYVSMCERVFGGYLHHQPMTGPLGELSVNGFNETKSLLANELETIQASDHPINTALSASALCSIPFDRSKVVSALCEIICDMPR